MTPDEAFQHDWIKEGMVHRSRNLGRTHGKRQQINAEQPPQQDPYKTTAGIYKGKLTVLLSSSYTILNNYVIKQKSRETLHKKLKVHLSIKHAPTQMQGSAFCACRYV